MTGLVLLSISLKYVHYLIGIEVPVIKPCRGKQRIENIRPTVIIDHFS